MASASLALCLSRLRRDAGEELAWDDVLSRSERSGGSTLLIRAMLQETSHWRPRRFWRDWAVRSEASQDTKTAHKWRTGSRRRKIHRGELVVRMRAQKPTGAQLKISQDQNNNQVRKRAQLAEEEANLSALVSANQKHAAQLQLELHQATQPDKLLARATRQQEALASWERRALRGLFVLSSISGQLRRESDG